MCEVLPLETRGTPVGALLDAEYISATFQLEIGDVLVAYTDGITETENPQVELWGQRRLENLLRSCSGRTPEEIIRCILDEILAFANGVPQRDDATLVVVRVEGKTGF